MKYIYGILGTLLIFSGCSTKKPQPKQTTYLKNIDYIVKKQQEKNLKEQLSTKSYHFMVKPIIGSEQDDSKVVVDMGKILKVWVAPYVYNGTLIASHDIYTWVQAPHFIAGESIGNSQPHSSSLITPNENYPLIYRPSEVYSTQAKFTNNELKKYVNKKYEIEKHHEKGLKQLQKQNNKYDTLIKQYLQTKQKD